MAVNKVQFQPGLSVVEFMELYGSDEKRGTTWIESC